MQRTCLVQYAGRQFCILCRQHLHSITSQQPAPFWGNAVCGKCGIRLGAPEAPCITVDDAVILWVVSPDSTSTQP